MSAPHPIAAPGRVPRHVAIIMDGNGRWAEARGQHRTAGHRAGVRAVRSTVRHAAERGIEVLTLFAFSSENWSRPMDEVGLLMQLFLEALEREVDELDANGVRLTFIGRRTGLSAKLVESMAQAEQRTRHHQRLHLIVALSYGGRLDLIEAARALAIEARDGKLDPADIDEARFAARVQLAGIPDPDLFIRTGGDHRISNFLLWNLAYTELWFTDVAWPDFDEAAFDAAIADFSERERRYGRTSAQVSTP